LFRLNRIEEVIMSIHVFRRNVDSGRGRLNIASTIVLLAVAAMGYNALAFVRETLPPPNDAATLARPDRGAETKLDNVPLAAPLVTVPDFDESRFSDAEWTESPRECDLGKGIASACLFMD
jgi:hypothetical protein